MAMKMKEVLMTSMRADQRAARRTHARVTSERLELLVEEIGDWLLFAGFSAAGFLVFAIAIWG